MLRLPEPSKHLAPRNAGVGGGWPVKAASGRQPCSSQTSRGKGAGSSRLGSAEAPKPPRSRSCPERDGASPGGKEEAQVHRSVPPLVLMPLRASAPGDGTSFSQCHLGHIYTHISALLRLPGFFPPSCGFAVDRGERLRVRALTAPPEKPGSDFPSEKREAERARKGKEPVGAEPAAPERGGGGARGLRYPPTESDPRLSSTPGWPLRSHEALLF